MLFITCVRINPGMLEEAKKFGDKLLQESRGVSTTETWVAFERM